MDICNVKPALTGGFMFPAGEWKLALAGRYIPSEYDLSFTAPVRAFSGKGGEHGAAAGISFKSYELSVDYALFRKGQEAGQGVVVQPFEAL